MLSMSLYGSNGVQARNVCTEYVKCAFVLLLFFFLAKDTRAINVCVSYVGRAISVAFLDIHNRKSSIYTYSFKNNTTRQ